MRRILLVLEPPDGGVAENVGQLATRLGDHGWQVEVAGPRDSVIYPALEAQGVPVHRLPFSRDYGDARREVAALRALSRRLGAGAYDLVHCHSAKAGVLGRIAAWRASVPAVYSPHALPFIGPVGIKRRVAARLAERLLAPLTATILCVSDDERREAAAAGLAGHGRLRVIPNGSEPCDGPPVVDEVLASLAARGPVVGAVAVLRRQKRLDLLIDAAPEILRRVPDAHVVIVGNGPLGNELREHAERVGLAADPRFAFLPFTPPPARFLRALDVFVLPSDWEGMPIAVLEALACGVPQVATAVGGTAEAVTRDTGVLIGPGDAGAVARAVVELLVDPARRRRMAEASVARHREHFTVERVVAMTAAVYDETLEPAPARGPGRRGRM